MGHPHAHIELRCSRDLALRLGAIGPETVAHHREMKNAGHILVRDLEMAWLPMFWPRVGEATAVAVVKSS